MSVVNLVTPPSTPGPEPFVIGHDDAVKRERSTETMYDSDEPVEVQPPQHKKQHVEAVASSSTDVDDCVVTATSGKNPLVDFPHARWNCCSVPIVWGQTGNASAFCPNCHCAICDVPASECEMWTQHCSADPRDPQVRKMREIVQKTGNLPARNCNLSQIKQIYPTEVDVQFKTVALKTYQKQCVSWMLDNEKNGFRTDRLFEDKPGRCKILYGGILALEMGMGKTLCAIALCKINPMPTIVVAPALNCVQWEAEFKQHAPELSVAMLYCGSQSKREKELLATDIVVVNHTSFLLEGIKTRVRRVIVDESHEVLSKRAPTSGCRSFLLNVGGYFNVRNMWLVSGTPFGVSETIDDPIFDRQLKVLIGGHAAMGHRTSTVKDDATVADVKALVMRMEKKQTYKSADGGTLTCMPIPDVEYKTLEVGLNETERELYNIAACVDGWAQTGFRIANKKNADAIIRDLDFRFALRQLVLGERIYDFESQIKKRLDEQFYVPDSEAPDLFYAKVDRMTHRIKECCKTLRSSNSKIDAVLADIAGFQKYDSNFKAVVITESQGAGDYIKRKIGDAVGVMQRPKGHPSIQAQRQLLKFQKGEYAILVCSFETVRIGTNLDQAGAIYFVDSSINDTDHKQACARISRCGTNHSKLTATFVYVKETLSEEIYKYHEDRRNGKTIEEAAARFEDDEPHEFSDPHDFHRIQHGRPFDQLKFTHHKQPDSLLTDLFTSEMDIDDMFEMICNNSDSDKDEYQIVLTWNGKRRPAMYELATQIVVVGKRQPSFRLVFDVPDHDAKSPGYDAKLVTTVRLTKEEADVLSSIGSWHYSVSSSVTVHMWLKNGKEGPLLDQLKVIKASCSTCKWCGWRKVHSYDVPFVGWSPCAEDESGVVPNNKLLTVQNKDGTLNAFFDYHIPGRTTKDSQYMPMTPMIREYINLAMRDKKQMGVVPDTLRYDALTHQFFERRPNIYKKVLVKLKDANINDTIRFDYKGRQYETFIREIIPTGPDWYAVAYVVESEQQVGTILIDEHTFVDMKRVVKHGADSFSIRDIIRMLRDNREKTDALKAIVLRKDISDAEKLKLAAALI